MITYRLSRHSYRIPDRWNDFTPDYGRQFVAMCLVFDLFETGKIDFWTMEAGIASALLGIDVTMVPRQNDILSENIFRLSERLRFPYRFRDNEDGSRTVSVNVVLRTNLLPKIRRYRGYRFGITADGVVDCDITAEQYVEALSLMDLYGKTRKDEVLDELVLTMYGKSMQGSSGTCKVSCKTGRIPRAYKVAVYYNLRGILEYLKMIPDFRLIFSPGERKSGGSSPLGLSSSIFTLSKSGYGTLQEIRNLDLVTYLGALVQMNIDGIYALQSAGVKPGEIAEKLNLPLDCVLPYLSVSNE